MGPEKLSFHSALDEEAFDLSSVRLSNSRLSARCVYLQKITPSLKSGHFFADIPFGFAFKALGNAEFVTNIERFRKMTR